MKIPQLTRRFEPVFAFLAILFISHPLSAAVTTLSFETPYGVFKVPTLENRSDISVDVLRLAEAMGAGTRESNGIYTMQFSSEIIKINPSTNIYSVRSVSNPEWRHVQLGDRSQIQGNRLFVALESIPYVFNQSFTYHLQRRYLKLGGAQKPAKQKGYLNVPVRFVFRDQKYWISLEDLCKTLGVNFFSFQTGSYSLTFPDFTILDLTVGSRTVLKRRIPFIQMQEPLLSATGSPYISLTSIPSVFEIVVKWDSASRVLMVPTEASRYREVQSVEKPQLVVIGYRPEKFKLNLEELSVYYQEPDPTYFSLSNRPYDSIRNFLDGTPINKKYSGADQVNGSAIGNFKGSLLQAPLEGRGSFEKVGPITRLNNGSMKYGFPMLEFEVGREFLTFSGLDNQFYLVNQVSLSHATDHYGEGKSNPNITSEVLYGETDFEIYTSTEFITQTVLFKQKMYNGSLGSAWRLGSKSNLAAKLDYFHFENEPLRVEANYNLPEFLEDILGSEPIPVDPAEVETLLKQTLTEKHDTAIFDLNFNVPNAIELSGVVGASRYKEELDEELTRNGTDWKLRSVLGGKRIKLDGSYEKISDYYRSVGNAANYRAKSVTRFAPYLEIFKWWRMFGDYRREDSHALLSQGVPPFRTEYANAFTVFNFTQNVIRISGNSYNSSLYGSRYVGNLDLTRYLGVHSIDLGGGKGVQYDSFDQVYKRTTSGKGGFTVNGKKSRLSLGEEYTQIVYATLDNTTRYESTSNMELRYGGFRAILQYFIEPRYYFRPEYLYTGFTKMEYLVGEKKYLDLYYAATSLRSNLADPEVWRVGIEFRVDLY